MAAKAAFLLASYQLRVSGDWVVGMVAQSGLFLARRRSLPMPIIADRLMPASWQLRSIPISPCDRDAVIVWMTS
jgi:hypothetical protein